MISTDWADSTTCCVFKHFVWHCDWYGMRLSFAKSHRFEFNFVISLLCVSTANTGKKVSWDKNRTFYLLNFVYLFILFIFQAANFRAGRFFWFPSIFVTEPLIWWWCLQSIFGPNCQLRKKWRWTASIHQKWQQQQSPTVAVMMIPVVLCSLSVGETHFKQAPKHHKTNVKSFEYITHTFSPTLPFALRPVLTTIPYHVGVVRITLQRTSQW